MERAQSVAELESFPLRLPLWNVLRATTEFAEPATVKATLRKRRTKELGKETVLDNPATEAVAAAIMAVAIAEVLTQAVKAVAAAVAAVLRPLHVYVRGATVQAKAGTR